MENQHESISFLKLSNLGQKRGASIFNQKVKDDPKRICDAWVQFTTSPIARDYGQLCGAIITFAFVAQVTIRKVAFQGHAQRNVKNMHGQLKNTHQLSLCTVPKWKITVKR